MVWLRSFVRNSLRPSLAGRLLTRMTDSCSSNSMADASTTAAIKSDLIETFLNLEKLDVNLYRGNHLLSGRSTGTTVYGGQVIGQALVAASKTVPDTYHAHSLHCYFIKAGNKNIPILYSVDRVRDGRSFCTRFVKALQEGESIFTCELSFHKEEPDTIQHSPKMPAVPPPEELMDGATLLKEYLKNADLSPEQRKFLQMRLADYPTTFEVKPTDPEAYMRTKVKNPHYLMWVKAKLAIGEDVRLHHCVAAYISDSSMVGTSLLPHLAAGFRVGMALTLDHSIWIHKYRFKIDDWMLYETESPIAAASRSLIFGKLWSRDGTLVLSTAQEALIRSKLDANDGNDETAEKK